MIYLIEETSDKKDILAAAPSKQHMNVSKPYLNCEIKLNNERY